MSELVEVGNKIQSANSQLAATFKEEHEKAKQLSLIHI